MNCDHPGFVVVTAHQYRSSIEAKKKFLQNERDRIENLIVNKFVAIIEWQDKKFYSHWWNRLFNRIASPLDPVTRARQMLDWYDGWNHDLAEPFFSAAQETFPYFYRFELWINNCRKALKPLVNLATDTIVHVTLDDAQFFEINTKQGRSP
jgi:hypothetical protein